MILSIRYLGLFFYSFTAINAFLLWNIDDKTSHSVTIRVLSSSHLEIDNQSFQNFNSPSINGASDDRISGIQTALKWNFSSPNKKISVSVLNLYAGSKLWFRNNKSSTVESANGISISSLGLDLIAEVKNCNGGADLEYYLDQKQPANEKNYDQTIIYTITDID